MDLDLSEALVVDFDLRLAASVVVRRRANAANVNFIGDKLRI